MDSKGFLWIIVAASFIEMWAAGTICDIVGSDNCKDEIGYAVSLAVISLAISVIMTLLNFFMEPPKILDMIVAPLLFGMWTFGILICTFYKPFTTMCNGHISVGNGEYVVVKTANGYVGMWVCFLASGAYMLHSIEFLTKLLMKASPETADGALLAGCGAASTVAMAQAAYLCDNDVTGYGNYQTADGCDKAHTWVVIWCTLALIVCILMMAIGALDQFKKYITTVLCLGYILTVLPMCFVYKDNKWDETGIFSQAGNGFFALWAALLSSFGMAWCGWSGMEAAEAFGHAGVFVPIIFVASFFEFWAAIVLCDKMNASDNYGSGCTDEYAFAVVAGLLGMVLSLIQLVLRIFLKDLAAKTQLPIAASLWIWWMVSLAVVCFKHPFLSMCSEKDTAEVTSLSQAVTITAGNYTYNSATWKYDGGDANGYIATWIAVFASTAMLMENETIHGMFTRIAAGSGSDGAYLSPLVMCSLVVMAQGAYDCDNRTDAVGDGDGESGCTSYMGWAVASGLISAVLGIILMFVSALKDFAKFVYLFLAGWWFCTMGSLTFIYKDQHHSGIYATANNGFFGCWGAFAISMLCCYVAWIDPNFSLAGEPEQEGGEGGDVEPKSDTPGVEANPTAEGADAVDGDLADADGVTAEVPEDEPETAKV